MATTQQLDFQARAILETAVQYLADKQNTTAAEIWIAVRAKQEQVCAQLAEIITWGIEYVQRNAEVVRIK